MLAWLISIRLLALTPCQAAKDDVTHAPVKPDNESAAANFPEPDVTLLSPAFIWPETVPFEFNNGTAGPTDDATVERFLCSLAARSDWMAYEASELTSEEGTYCSNSLSLLVISTLQLVEPCDLKQTSSMASRRCTWE